MAREQAGYVARSLPGHLANFANMLTIDINSMQRHLVDQ
jgi:hypothetical protein